MSTISYIIANCRPVRPSGKVAEKNPNLLFTVHGEFRTVDENGKVSAEPLTITAKQIERETALKPEFAFDPVAGTLTLPAGDRGRKSAIGMSADDVLAMLADLRDGELVEDGEASA